MYLGETVADGMYDSLNTLKATSMDQYNTLPPYTDAVDTYHHLIKLASKGGKIHKLTQLEGEKLLHRVKSSVLDWYSITSLPFLHLGQEGISHFVFLINAILNHINSSTVEELNTI